jgi:hypothetical protein
MSSSGRRICTIELKVVPMIDYVLSLNGHCIIIQGIRTERIHKQIINERSMYLFKYYFEPYQTNTMIQNQIESVLNEKEYYLMLKGEIAKS